MGYSFEDHERSIWRPESPSKARKKWRSCKLEHEITLRSSIVTCVRNCSSVTLERSSLHGSSVFSYSAVDKSITPYDKKLIEGLIKVRSNILLEKYQFDWPIKSINYLTRIHACRSQIRPKIKMPWFLPCGTNETPYFQQLIRWHLYVEENSNYKQRIKRFQKVIICSEPFTCAGPNVRSSEK